MLARVARFQMLRIIVFVMVRCCPMMVVCSEPMMVFRMIVIVVGVDVQRGDLAGRPGPDQCEQYRHHARHNPSVRNALPGVKLRTGCGRARISHGQGGLMNLEQHWQEVYRTKHSQDVSWFRPHLNTSLELIRQIGVSGDAPILDVGGGASTLVDDLLAAGYPTSRCWTSPRQRWRLPGLASGGVGPTWRGSKAM